MPVERRELGRGLQPDRTVFLQRLQTQIEVRRHLSQIYSPPDTLQQVIHRPGAVSHVHARTQHPRGRHRRLAYPAADTQLADIAFRNVGDDDFHRNQRHGFVNGFHEGFHAHHVAPVAAQHKAVQIGESLDFHALLQRRGNNIFDFRNRPESQRNNARRRKTVALGRTEHVDATLAVVGILRPLEQHGKQRFEIRRVDPDASRQAHRRLEVIVQPELPAQIEDNILHLPAHDVGRDAPQRIDLRSFSENWRRRDTTDPQSSPPAARPAPGKKSTPPAHPSRP